MERSGRNERCMLQMDTGYWMWSFQGKIIRRNNSNSFCEFKWRPRPPTLLTEGKLKDIKKSLKKYTLQFEQKDRIRLTKASKVRTPLIYDYQNFEKYFEDLFTVIDIFNLGCYRETPETDERLQGIPR